MGSPKAELIAADGSTIPLEFRKFTRPKLLKSLLRIARFISGGGDEEPSNIIMTQAGVRTVIDRRKKPLLSKLVIAHYSDDTGLHTLAIAGFISSLKGMDFMNLQIPPGVQQRFRVKVEPEGTTVAASINLQRGLYDLVVTHGEKAEGLIKR